MDFDYIDDEIGAEAAAAEMPPEQKQDEKTEQPENRRALVSKILACIRADKKHHGPAFKRMKRDMFVAFHGRDPEWSEKHYKANIAGRHVKMKTAQLFAKNPKAVANRVERLDFAVWDETLESLMQAQATVAMGQQAAMAQEQAITAAAGAAQAGDQGAALALAEHNQQEAVVPSEPVPGFADAVALIEDFTQGMERRKQFDRLGKTLEIVYAKAMREQKPVDFKTGLKQVVRRTCTTGVGYVELGFQRAYGPDPVFEGKLADERQRLAHIREVAKELEAGDLEEADAEVAELEMSIQALQLAPEVVIREGLVFDYPRSTKVIPDRLTKILVGFIGARHVTIEYDYTHAQVQELFGIDLERYKGYAVDGEKGKTVAKIAGELFNEEGDAIKNDKHGLVRVWKRYDKVSGLVYYVADGYHDFLREPAAPDVFVEDFWPVYACTFNEVENEDELFPPSDVHLLDDMQREHNRSRQGKREHREAARPRWGYAKSALSNEEDVKKIEKVRPFEAIGLDIDPSVELEKVLQSFPVPGVDPNLYDTNEAFSDAQLVVGAQEAQLGGLAKATATESAIAANSAANSDTSSIDDLDTFLTTIARSAGQILLREMAEDTVMALVGPGAFWPEISLTDLAGEIFLEIEAGSSGRPNKAAEVANWKTMLPFLIQMPKINHEWLARETLKRLDDKMDLTDAIAPSAPSIMSANRLSQMPPADPAQDPANQGPEGADKAPKPADTGTGSDPAFGSNQM